MEIRYYKEYSPCLEREMEYKVYGYGGQPILVFPAQNGRFYDFENFGMIDSIASFIDEGRIQVFCVDSIDGETWSHENGEAERRSYLHEQWFYYVCHELVPRIREINRSFDRIITVGCSMGATHAVNFMFRRPDLFLGTIGLSGYYDSDIFFKDYCDERIYNNAPVKYLAGMAHDHPYIDMYKNCKIVLCCGQGAWEDEMRHSIHQMKNILADKGIPAWIDLWGNDVDHDWPWWKQQLPYFLENIL